MSDNLIENLYNSPLALKNGKEVTPFPIREIGCVQYGRRLPEDLLCSVHYEVSPNWENEIITGYKVALHTEDQTAEGNKEIRENLISFLKSGLRSRRAIWDSRFVLGRSWVYIDLHNENMIPPDLSAEQFVETVRDLLSELYELVEELLIEAEHDKALNPYGYDEEELQKVQNEEPILIEPNKQKPDCDEELWGTNSSITIVNVTRLLLEGPFMNTTVRMPLTVVKGKFLDAADQRFFFTYYRSFMTV